MQEQQKTQQGIGFWLGSLVSTLILIICLWGVYTVRQYLSIVGIVLIVSIPLLIVGAIAFLVAKAVGHLLEYRNTEIGPNGNILSRYGKLTFVHPLGIKEFRVRDTDTAKQVEKVEIPSLISLLKEGILGGTDLLLGYHTDGSPRWGVWDDLRTFIIAGKSRSGKTVTMVFFIVQAILAGAKLYVCDPHARKRDGLLKVLEPLIPVIQHAIDPDEIVALAKAFTNAMQARERGESSDTTPLLFVVDEWTKLLRDLAPDEVEILVNVFLNCAEAWAAFGGYALIAGHEWTARDSGGNRGTALRRNTHAAFVHRLDADYAKFLLQGSKGKKAANNAPNLPKGHVYLQDSEGELDYLVIPYYGSRFEAIQEVASLLLPSGERKTLPYSDYRMLTSESQVNSAVNSKQTEETAINTHIELLQGKGESVYHGDVYSQAPDESVNTEGVNERLTDNQIKSLIVRMHKRNIAMRDIAYTVSLYGRNYDTFKRLCFELGLHNTETT